MRAVCLVLVGCAAAPVPPPKRSFDRVTTERDVARVIDDFHDAAARADEARLIADLTEDAVFLGTDAKERWSPRELRAYAHPRFERGQGWVFHVTRRAITVRSEDLAWFDEDIRGEKLGDARGSGVVTREGGRWRIAQYNLAVTIPNEKFVGLRALLDPPPDLRARHKIAYAEATRVAKDDPARAAAILLPLALEAKRDPASDLEFWIRNQLTWLRWSAGDLAGALGEVDAAKAALDHATLSEEETRALRLHELWDRAYLLLDSAAERRGSIEAARAAKTAYDALAKVANDHDGMNVLEAYFASFAKDARAALAAARRVDVERDADLQDLYVIALALDAGGDHDGAKKVRARVCAGAEYLMKPLLVRRMAQSGAPCP